jgi:hypothetical protein
MKNLTLILLCFSSFAYGLKPNTKQKLSSNLIEVNKYWKNQDVSKFEEEVSFSSDIERIQKHLFSVIELLQKSNFQFSQNHLEKRLNLLNELYIYAEKKVFPINLYHKERTPYFIDHLGTHCAVGYLMLVSGNGDLAQKISKNENYAYVKDIQTKGVVEWAENHGFSLEELALVQPNYSNIPSFENLDGTTNGPVKHLVPIYDMFGGSISILYFGGEFSELKGLPCANIGYYQDNQLSCLAGGLNGKLIEIKEGANSQLFAAGDFLHNGEKFQIAKLVNNTWEFSALPISEDFEVLAFDAKSFLSYNDSYLFSLAIRKFSSENTEIWSLERNASWKKTAETNGRVLVIESNVSNEVLFGGNFNKVYLFNENELVDSLNVNNIVRHNVDFVYDNIIQGLVSDTITSILYSNESYYFGGTFTDAIPSSIAVSKYLNNVMQPLIVSSNFANLYGDYFYQINKMRFDDFSGKLLLSGDFSSVDFFIGQGFASYNLAQNILEPINHFWDPIYLNGEIHDFVKLENRYYYAGDFFNTSLNAGYLVREPSSIGISENINSKLTIFPNPATNKLQFVGLENSATYEIRDNLGRIIQSGQILNHEINIENLAISSYNIMIKENDKVYNEHFIKN